MELYGQILVYAIPSFLVLVILEKLYGYFKGNDTVEMMDMYSSLSSGITNSTKDVLGLSITLLSYQWLLDHLAIFTIQNSVLICIVAFITLDFQGYWVHRWAHKINFFWNKHLIHHSSEEFNLACALRQSISSFLNIFTFFLIPCALVGIPSLTIAIIAPIHLFAQFWYHTRHIDKMGFLEKIIVTPSHHRVHHAINPVYIDKNYGQIFILWDKWFGTYQEELVAHPPVYGITHPVSTWNPIKINFQHMGNMFMDAIHTKNWAEKFTLWFRPTGYRPADVIAQYPVTKIDDVYHFEKYRTQASTFLQFWAGFRTLATLLIISYFYGFIGNIGVPEIYWYGLFIFVTVYSFTEMMDRNKNAIIYESITLGMTSVLIYWLNGWFGIDTHFANGTMLLLGYQILCWMMTFYFSFLEKNKSETHSNLSTQ
jgi:alkylglycerol monooxygenase